MTMNDWDAVCVWLRWSVSLCGGWSDYDEMTDWVTTEWPLTANDYQRLMRPRSRPPRASCRPVDTHFDAVSLSVCLSVYICVCAQQVLPLPFAVVSPGYSATAVTRTVTGVDLVVHLSSVIGTKFAIGVKACGRTDDLGRGDTIVWYVSTGHAVPRRQPGSDTWLCICH